MATYRLNANLTLNESKHDDLVRYIKDLLMSSSSVRNFQCARFERIDKEVYGFLKPDEDDARRQKDNRRGEGVKPTDTKLPFTLSQLEEAVTYALLVLAPDEGIYSALTKKDEMSVAQAFSALMNKNADTFGHYAQLSIFLLNAFKYNYGGLRVEWQRIMGNTIQNSTGGQFPIVVENQIVSEGNKLIASDPYNTLYDTSVNPLEVYRDGEFVAFVDIRSWFWLKRAENRQEVYNFDMIRMNDPEEEWYIERPEIDYEDGLIGSDGGSGRNRFFHTLRPFKNFKENETDKEVITIYMQIYPNQWGLSKEKELEIWRFTLIGDTIISGVHQTNAHGLLPHVISMPNEDGFIWRSKSWAQHLTPLNRFASFELNIAQDAARRALYNLIFYDKNLFGDLSSTDLVAGQIPVKAVGSGSDVDFRKKIFVVSDAPRTESPMRNMQEVQDIMEQVFPTRTQNQVASMDRATQYQSAAVVQGANKRNLKAAKIVNTQAFAPMKHMQMYNILQFQNNIEIIDETGNTVEINPQSFRDASLEFAISDGLRGLDKLLLISTIKEILNVIVQSQQALAYFDIPAIVNHWTTLVGDQTDFSQFRIKSQIDQLPPEQKQQAFELLMQQQQAEEQQT